MKDFDNCLLDYISLKIVVDEAFEFFFLNLTKKLYNNSEISFELKESKSALKKCVIQYRNDEKDGFDLDLFLVNAKQPITNLLSTDGSIEIN